MDDATTPALKRLARSRARYRARLRRVLDHIDRHLDEDLSLAALADVAAFSAHHFHRQFVAALGVTPHRYVQLARLKRASHRLAFRADATVTGVALDAGYEAPDAFARAFRDRIGQAPSAFRERPAWESWRATFEPLSRIRRTLMTDFATADVTIREVPSARVAVMTHRGDPARIGDTIRRFIAWRKAAGLGPTVSATYTVFHDDPRTTPPAEFRLDLCAGLGAATDRALVPHDDTVDVGVIPGGRCAVLRVVGAGDDVEPAALFLYRDWLPASGEEPRDFPLYCRRVTLYPDVPEHEVVTDLYLPLTGRPAARPSPPPSASPRCSA